MGSIHAVQPNLEVKILPIDCIFDIIDDGSNRITYLTPKECGVLVDDPIQTPPTTETSSPTNNEDKSLINTEETDPLVSKVNIQVPAFNFSLSFPRPWLDKLIVISILATLIGIGFISDFLLKQLR